MELIQKLEFERVSGTDGEVKAAHMLLDELKKIGLEGKMEPFELKCGQVMNVALVDDNGRSYRCTGYELSAQTPEKGIEAELIYVEQINSIKMNTVAGKIVLIDGKLTTAAYYALIEADAAGFITYGGRFNDDNDRTDLDQKALRDLQLLMPKIPGVHLRAMDAIELISSGCRKVCMKLELNERTATSHNVIAQINGIEHPEEIIIFTAHYDTVKFSKGPYDNASGVAMMMEIAREFAAHPVKRTLRFIWCGAEEMGIVGSKAYVKAHETDIKNMCLVINCDLEGAVLGEDNAVVMAEQALADYISYMAKEMGFPIKVARWALPSDCTRFVAKGVPAVGFGRYSAEGAGVIHERYDSMCFMSASAMRHTTEFVCEFARRMADAHSFPVKRAIPEDMQKMVDEYLYSELETKYATDC